MVTVTILGVTFLILIAIIGIAAAVGQIDKAAGCGGSLVTLAGLCCLMFIVIGINRACEEDKAQKEKFRRISDEWSEGIRKRKEEINAYELELKRQRASQSEKDNKNKEQR